MPELPEVETIKIGLSKRVIGLSISNIEILNPKTFPDDKELVIRKTILNVWRRAKVLGIDVEGGYSLIFHLKMSGQVIYTGERGKSFDSAQDRRGEEEREERLVGGHPTIDMRDEMPNNSTRVYFELSNGGRIYFNDQRKFGWVKVVKTEELNLHAFLSKLGPEPLEKDFTPAVLKEALLKHKSMPIKVGMMDQQLISGIGNIYASEACFNAKINPKKKPTELTDNDFKKLHQGIVKALQDGIKYGGSSRAHYVNAEGEKGLFLDYAFVYQREGALCKVCGTPIEKIRQGGRSTFFCPTCQSEK